MGKLYHVYRINSVKKAFYDTTLAFLCLGLRHTVVCCSVPPSVTISSTALANERIQATASVYTCARLFLETLICQQSARDSAN